MSGTKSWSKNETNDLISKYREFEELWNVKSENFRNRRIKKVALESLSKHSNTTIEEVKRKLHNLRNQFRAELQKTVPKINSEIENDLNYDGKWEFFYSLFFLRDQMQCRRTTNDIQVKKKKKIDKMFLQ